MNPEDGAAVAALLPGTRVGMDRRGDRVCITVNDRDVTDELRSPEISTLASLVSAIPAVREWLLPVQRRLGDAGGVVAEGRDIGTRVFPAAEAKFFLDADVNTRAGRRQQDLTGAGRTAPLEETKQEIESRDQRDRSRAIAPLIPAEDAEIIDSTSLTVEQVIDRMMGKIAAKL